MDTVFSIFEEEYKLKINRHESIKQLFIGAKAKNIEREKLYDIILQINRLRSYKNKDDEIHVYSPSFRLPTEDSDIEQPMQKLKPIHKEGQCGYVDQADQVVIPLQFERTDPKDFWVCRAFSEGLAAVRLDPNHYGYLDETGKIVIPAQFDDAWPFYRGLAWVQVKDHYQRIDKTGQVVIPPQPFDDFIWSYQYDFGWFRSKDRYGYINGHGKISWMPQIIHHAEPALTTVLNSFGCQSLQNASNLLGGLNPNVIIARCVVDLHEDRPQSSIAQWEENEFFYEEGCMYPVQIRYLAMIDGKIQLIKNKQQFKTLFSPIESPEEALSYLVALTGESAFYNLKTQPKYTYFVDTIEDTHVVLDPDHGYRINLYEQRYCGCGPKGTVEKVYNVTKSGDIHLVSKRPVYVDNDQSCVD